MNARFNMNTPEEAAKSIGVCTPVVVGWCRTGVINCNRVGEGTQKDRYEISDDEVHYIRNLIHKFGAKQGILRYRKDWAKGGTPVQPKVEKEEPGIIGDPSPSQEYLWKVAAKYIGVDEAAIRRYCSEGRINCRTEKNESGKGNRYYIPGWELLYIKGLYDRYGKVGRTSAMHYYVKDREDNKAMIPWNLDYDQVEDDVTKAMVEYSEGSIGTNEFVEKVQEIKETPKKEQTPNDFATTFMYLKDIKLRIEDCKTELEHLEKERDELKKELMDALAEL